MKTNKIKTVLLCFIPIFLAISCFVFVVNVVVPAVLDEIFSPYLEEKYNSVEDAIHAMELYERELNDTSLDFIFRFLYNT